MKKRMLMTGIIIVTAGLIVFSAPPVPAQDYCEGNFDYDQDVDGSDASTFKSDFGRSAFQDPCPPDGPAPLARTGQTASYIKGDDGYFERGIAWPNPRFTDNGDGTVTDNLTGLMWLKDANCIASEYKGFDNDFVIEDGRVTWEHAFDFVEGINDGTYVNCGAGYTSWRVPNKKELISLTHAGYLNPALPNTAGTGQWSEGDPFINVHSFDYWSSTNLAITPSFAWSVHLYYGAMYGNGNFKDYTYYVWPVRGGQ